MWMTQEAQSFSIRGLSRDTPFWVPVQYPRPQALLFVFLNLLVVPLGLHQFFQAPPFLFSSQAHKPVPGKYNSKHQPKLQILRVSSHNFTAIRVIFPSMHTLIRSLS